MHRAKELLAAIMICVLSASLFPMTVHADGSSDLGDPSAEEEAADEALSCDGDAQDLLSKQWVLQKVDCAVDWAVKKLIDKGVSILSDIAKDLVSAAAAQFLPGLNSLFDSVFGGGGGDPFAAHVQTILDHIDKSTAKIIDHAVDIYTSGTLIEVKGLLTAMRSYEPLLTGELAVLANKIKDTEEDLNTARLDLQRLDIFGVESLHHYVTVVAALLEAQGIAAVAVPYADARDTGYDMNDPEIQEYVRGRSEDLFKYWSEQSMNGSPDAMGVFEYVASLVPEYRMYNETRFGEPEFDSRKTVRCGNPKWSQRPIVVNEEKWVWTITEDRLEVVGEPIERHFSWTHTRTATHATVPEGNLQGCPTTSSYRILLVEDVEGSAPIIDFEYTYDSPVESGVVSTIGLPEPTPGPEQAYQFHKDEAYEELVITSYGAARPIIDRWWDMVNPGQERDMLAVDYELEEFVTGSPNVGAAFGRLAAAFPSGMDDETLRWAVNLVLEHGVDAVDAAAYAATLRLGTMDPRLTRDYLNELLRANTQPADYEGAMRSRSIALFVAATNM